MSSESAKRWEIETPHETVQVDAATAFTSEGELHLAGKGSDGTPETVAIFARGHWEYASHPSEKSSPTAG